MRQLTDSERKAREQAWIKHINNKGLNSSPIDFEAGLFAGLDHSAGQLAALTAERDALKLQADGLKQHAAQSLIKYTDAAAECEGLIAERDGLRAALKPLADLWRDSLADKPDDTPTYGFNDVVITVGQIREARRALDKSKPTTTGEHE